MAETVAWDWCCGIPRKAATSIPQRCGFLSQLFHFCPSYMLMYLGKQQIMAQMLAPLPSTWVTRTWATCPTVFPGALAES